MRKLLLAVLLPLLLLSPAAFAAVATVYIDTGGCETGSTTRCSGTTDSASATASGAAATITCSGVAGPGGLTGCSLTGTPNLSGVAVDGSQALYVDCATNSNQKIFFINAVDDTGDLVGTTVAPTGCTAATSDWGIGGRLIYDSAKIEAAPRPGDTIQFNNTPASKAADFFTLRVAGDNTGFIKMIGKAGVRPVLNVTNTTQVIQGAAFAYWWFENLEFDQDGASGNVVDSLSSITVLKDIKISDGGGHGIQGSISNLELVNSEITGVGGDGINSSGVARFIDGNYIHDLTGNGITTTSTTPTTTIINNTIDSVGGKGIYFSGAIAAAANHSITVQSNTIYGSGDSGLEVADADLLAHVMNNIFQDNGNAAGEFNVEWVAGTAEASGFHGYNVFYHQGGGGGANLSNLTVNATETTTDPLFTDAAGGNFSIGASSPAKATAYPGIFLGGSTGYLDMGAVQRQEASGGGGHVIGG